MFCTILYKPKNENSKTNTSFVTSHCLVTTPFKWLLKWRESLQSTFRKRLFVLFLDGTTHRSKQRFYMFHNWQKKFMGSLCLSQAILNVQSICRRAATANQLKPIEFINSQCKESAGSPFSTRHECFGALNNISLLPFCSITHYIRLQSLARGKIIYFATLMDTNRHSAHQSQNEDNFPIFSLGLEFLKEAKKEKNNGKGESANNHFWYCCLYFASDLMHNSTGYVIKQLVHASSCALSSYGARGKFGEHSRS